MTREQRMALAQKRIVNVLRTHVLATDRTLEQKIADAGPNNQRVEPGILTKARRALIEKEQIGTFHTGQTPWFYLAGTGDDQIVDRLAELLPIYERTQEGNFKRRAGQALEIAVQRALDETEYGYLGSYNDLEAHDDSQTYQRTEPPLIVRGRRIEKGPLDYVAFPSGITSGIEVKNYRTWLYPDSTQVKELLWKCSDIGAVPILITRRVPFITFRLLNLSGGIVHQNYNQLYPKADEQLAQLARDKTRLGYHDVRVGNEPDARMKRFFGTNLPKIVKEAKEKFDEFQGVHSAYGKGEIRYYDWMKAILMGNGIWQPREGEPPEGAGEYLEAP